jgi:hypothetical protein
LLRIGKYYPLAKQNELLQQKIKFGYRRTNKANFQNRSRPSQLSIRSDAIAYKLAKRHCKPANKDQYKATLDFNQLLYNGGLIDANTKIKEAQTKTAATARSEFISTENENKSAVFSIFIITRACQFNTCKRQATRF